MIMSFVSGIMFHNTYNIHTFEVHVHVQGWPASKLQTHATTNLVVGTHVTYVKEYNKGEEASIKHAIWPVYDASGKAHSMPIIQILTNQSTQFK